MPELCVYATNVSVWDCYHNRDEHLASPLAVYCQNRCLALRSQSWQLTVRVPPHIYTFTGTQHTMSSAEMIPKHFTTCCQNVAAGLFVCLCLHVWLLHTHMAELTSHRSCASRIQSCWPEVFLNEGQVVHHLCCWTELIYACPKSSLRIWL